MKLPVLLSRIKVYRKLRHRKGHGVHSPLAYGLITKVIEEKCPYYIFEEIERIRQALIEDSTLITYPGRSGKITQHTIGEITLHECHHRRYGALLFRLVTFFKASSVLNVGSSSGVMSFYLASPHSNCRCVALERRQELVAVAEDKAKQLGMENLHFYLGTGLDDIEKVLQGQPGGFDLIFIDTAYDPELTGKIMSLCLQHFREGSVLIMDGINRNKSMQQLWKAIKLKIKGGITLDLYALGIIFANHKMYKKNYITYFNHGKKQNIHKGRRWRFHFLSRRKKSFKNAFTFRGLRNRR